MGFVRLIGLVASTSLLFACGGRTFRPIDDTKKARDAGPFTPRDSGPITLFRDGGVTRRDAGVTPVCGDGICGPREDFISCPQDCRPPDDCPNGTEGCECNSTWDGRARNLLPDDCELGLLCMPWDTVSGRGDLVGPVQSCIRPCMSNADCGPQRTCSMALARDEPPRIGGVCVDQIAEMDFYCGGSRLETPRLPGVPLRTAGRIVGCPNLATCVMNVLDDVHPDEGVCLQVCGRPGDAGCVPPFPYCNPNVLADGAGVCSVGQLQPGAWCNNIEQGKVGLTSLCDASDATAGNNVCVGLGIDRGLCFELCNDQMPCQFGPAGAYYCDEELLQGGGGLCLSTDCGSFPDTCDGPGTDNVGRQCLPLTEANEGICTDRIAPTLRPARLDSMGNLMDMGEDCQIDQLGFARCPEGTICFAAGNGGACIVGCNTADVGYCTGALDRLGLPSANAACVDVIGDPAMGICGGD